MKHKFQHWSFGGARWTWGTWDGVTLRPSACDYLNGTPLHGAAIIGMFSNFGKQLIMCDSAINPMIMETN
jgi:hypothetical protein